MKLIAYHGTCVEFEQFKLPENLPKGSVNFTNGYLGIYFTENKDVAKMFCKEKWYIKNSKYKPNSRIITAEIEILNPRVIYPIEHARGGSLSPQHNITLRYYLSEYYQHDSVIIREKRPDEQFRCSKSDTEIVLPWKSEYDGKQVIVFSPNSIVIKDIKQLN